MVNSENAIGRGGFGFNGIGNRSNGTASQVNGEVQQQPESGEVQSQVTLYPTRWHAEMAYVEDWKEANNVEGDVFLETQFLDIHYDPEKDAHIRNDPYANRKPSRNVFPFKPFDE